MNKVKIIGMADFLEKFDFVMWDRFVQVNNTLSLYGWIDRKKDNYKDFIVLLVDKPTGKVSYVTSSEEKHNEIIRLLQITTSPKCQRIEYSYKIKNSIKLGKI